MALASPGVGKIEATEATTKDLEFEIQLLNKENKSLENVNENQTDTIDQLEISNAKRKQVCDNLNVKLNETKTKFKKEKTNLLKEHRKEIKSWRIELGEETREKIKLEEKLNEKESSSPVLVPEISESHPLLQSPISTISLETTFCSICANPIVNFTPKYFLGEQFNPACDKCDPGDLEYDILTELNPSLDPQIDFVESIDPDTAFILSTSSMVSNWIPRTYSTLPLAPGSIVSMVCHCAQLPNPGNNIYLL